jgi:hypothetical protein
MYTDLRPGLGNFSAETLTLIDDEAVNRQIEVGHLVDQLRDSCDEKLGRINIMIAQLHGKSEVKERENPFRPYLIARALHDVLHKMVKDEGTAAVLFKYCANSLARYLPEYYAELCDVFSASGVRAQLVARPGTLTRYQREQLARQSNATQGNAGSASKGSGQHIHQAMQQPMQQALPANFDQKMMPSLQRLLKLMQQQTALDGLQHAPQEAGQEARQDSRQEIPQRAPTGNSPPAANSAEDQAAFLHFVSNIFSQAHNNSFAAGAMSDRQHGHKSGVAHRSEREQHDLAGAPASSAPMAREPGSHTLSSQAPASQELIARLNEFQHMAARGRPVNDQIAPLQNQLFAVREQVDAQTASQPERMALDVIAVLFEFILGDEQIPEGLRAQIGRLQIPFLKAAMLDSGLLQQEDHPCRMLLNRMGSIAVGMAPDTEMGQSVAVEIKRIVRKILDEFDKDVAIFSTCIEELEHFLADKLRHTDSNSSLSIEAMEEAEKIGVLTRETSSSVRERLLPLNVDKRVADFIVDTWVRVLVRAMLQDDKKNGADGVPTASSDSLYQHYYDVLPELVWSAQDKQTPQDRTALMRLLPPLVKRLKSGLMLLNFSEDDSKRALDQLVAVHTQILRNSEVKMTENLPSLDALRQAFSGVVIHDESTDSKAVARPQVDADVIAASLAERGATASLDLQRDSTFSSRLDESWLPKMKVGTSVECLVDDTYQMGRLIWVGKSQSLFMFRLDVNSKPLVYSSASLSAALREGHLNLIEPEPTFERAVASLLQGAEVVQERRATARTSG